MECFIFKSGYVCHTGGKWQNALPVTVKEDFVKAVLAIFISVKDVLPTLHYQQGWSTFVSKVGESHRWKMAKCVASYMQPKKAALAVYVTAKDVLPALHY